MPEPPELPEAARPRWPAWYAPAGLGGAFGALIVFGTPLLPVILIGTAGEAFAGVSLLVLLIAQDGMLMGTAVLFASFRKKPQLWHFGVRATRFWPTIGLTVLACVLMLGFELGYIELFGVDETNVEDLGKDNLVAGIAVSLAVIVLAPVSEEFFFRAFFYRALRNRFRVWSAALIDGLVFGLLHFTGLTSLAIIPVIAVFGVVLCLVYERTGSLFAVIAIHAVFNTIAMLGVTPVVALVVGVLVLTGCLLAARRFGRAPAPLPV